jgi:PAS domain S-box-containing protein
MSETFNKDPFGAEATEPDADKNFLVVGLGASAGGIQALREFFARVPAGSGMAYVVILHLSPDHDSQLAEVLQSAAAIPVTQVENHVRVEPNHVYVIPPNKSLAINDGHLEVSNMTSTEVRRAPVDIFFRTLADSHGARAVSVVLSGTGANGSMGMKRVKEMGGLCIVQDPQETEYGDMPRHSMATGLVDYVLPVGEIPAQIIAYREQLRLLHIPEAPPEQTEADADALRDIFTQLRVRTGHDFSNYKRATVMRRIARRMSVHELPGLLAYSQFMHERPQEANALLKDLLISVTNFFRDREAFEKLERDIIPKLFEGKKADDHVRVWVAGCATGEEAYSLTMMLMDYVANVPDPPQVQVFATDIDEDAIAAARDGYYTLNDAADVPPARLSRYFMKEANDGYRIRRELRERVLFAVHNVIKDPPFAHLDLVTCRNLLIYLNRTAQRRVMDVLHFALNPGGYMMLGASESVEGAGDLYIPVDKEHRIYQGRAVETRLVFPIPDGPLVKRLGKLPEMRQLREFQTPHRSSYAELHQRLLERYAPPSVVVNENYDIMHMSESAGHYMEIKGGELSANLLKLIRPELRLVLRAALYQATQESRDVESRGLPVLLGEEMKTINVRVRPVLSEEDTTRGFLLILFEEAREANAAEQGGLRVSADDEPLARRLEDELLEVRAELSLTIEQHEIQKEELKASNEELQAMNEEMRSAAEELETSKEELQSINEELTTVNQELKIKIEELGQSNDDFKNLMNLTQVGTVFLDRSLHVKLFTPRARDIFNLIPADLGRQLSDITSRLGDDRIIEDAESVLESLRAVEREVLTKDGRAFLMQIAPYRTIEDRINGVVITFMDITERQLAEEATRRSEEQFRRAIEDAPIPVIMHAEDGEVLQVSRTWTELTGYTLEDVQNFDAWLTRAYGEGADAVRHHMQELFKGDRRTLNIEFPIRTRDGDVRHWSFSASSPGTLRDNRRFIVGMAVEITESKRVDEALRESEERFRAMFEQANIGIVQVMMDGQLMMPNKGFCRMIGYTEEEMRHLNLHDISHPDDYEKEVELTRQVMAGEIPGFSIMKRYIRKGGGVVWGSMTATVVRNTAHDPLYLVAIVEDVGERIVAEERLRESEERLRLTMESVKDYAILTLDTEGRIQSWNAGAERAFGYTEDEVIGQHTAIIFTPEDRQRGVPDKEMKTAREQGRAADERWHVRRDGSRVYVSGVQTPLRDGDGDGEVTGYVKVARDLTEQKRVEEELRRAHDELEANVRERTFELAKANETLRAEISERIQTERSRVRLLRQIVRAQEDERRRIARDIHDQLGQQMTALRLNLAALDQGCSHDEELRRKLAQTKNIAERLDADVDFLAWELRPAALDDIGLAEALGKFVREWSKHSGIEAEFHTTGMDKERLSPETETNLYRITQEALNNTMKYARASRVDVLLERRDHQVVLIVEDDGVGFDPKKMASQNGEKGMGLIGMRERAMLVGGTLEIESKPKEGTTIFARVPVKFQEEEEVEESK